jgi:hypothetical protein
MAVWDLFSKREKRKSKQGQEEVFQYDSLPAPFRVQVIHIWADALGEFQEQDRILGSHIPPDPNVWWFEIFKIVTREKGVFRLCEESGNPCVQCRHYMMKAATEDALDLIELTFRFIDGFIRQKDPYERQRWRLVDPDSAIDELNARFREHGIGYEYIDGEIIRVDSKLIHSEVVKPALQLLHGAGKDFKGPLQEFLDAHERYRKGEYEDAITWALKAFESTLKSICTVRKWPFDQHKDTAKPLLDIVFSKGLMPPYLQTQFAGLRSALESGVPTIRNKTSGHGQGATPTIVPAHLAAFVLHLTASNIVFLIESHRAIP